MRDAILIVRKAKGAPSLKLGAPDELRAEFKKNLATPPAGASSMELWDSSGGRVRRQAFKLPNQNQNS